MNAKEREILIKAIQTFGKQSQFVVTIEELSELTKELTKNLRGEANVGSITEEIADVEIMLDQLKLMLFAFGNVQRMREYKLKRLEERIKEAKP